jgi:AbiV family abortive infection protein
MADRRDPPAERTISTPTSPDTLRKMRDALVENVCDLAADARALCNAKRWRRASALSILCGEEFSKLLDLDAILTQLRSGATMDWPRVQREIVSHQIKTTVFAPMAGGVQKFEGDWEWLSSTMRMGDHPIVAYAEADSVNRFKQDLIYVPATEPFTATPIHMVTPEKAEDWTRSAEALAALVRSVIWN